MKNTLKKTPELQEPKRLERKYAVVFTVFCIASVLAEILTLTKKGLNTNIYTVTWFAAGIAVFALWHVYKNKSLFIYKTAAYIAALQYGLLLLFCYTHAAFIILPFFAAALFSLRGITELRGFYDVAVAQIMAGPRKSSEESSEEESITFEAVESTVRFDDMHGMSELKNKLMIAAKEITKTDDHGRHTQKARNGILLFGLPGNGKTFIAEVLAGEIGIPIISVTFGDVANVYVNATTQSVKKAFRDAVAQAPCVLFLDEIDSLITDRSKAFQSDSESQKTTNAILTELVNIRNKGVVVMAATNFLDRLDRAATREGRFDFKIEVTPPDQTARQGLLIDAIKKHCKSESVIDVEACVRATGRWEGYSVARIKAVGEEIGAMFKDSVFNKADFNLIMAALRRVQGRKGSIPSNTKSLSEMILPDDLRVQLKTIAARMKDIERVEKLGGTVPTGLLFFGDPGTGKTETARCLAKETGWAFLHTSGNSLIMNPDSIDKLVADAADIRPCIVFIDEADDVLANRQMSSSVSVANKLLGAIDGAGGKVRDVVYIAATNHPESIDPAFLRGGRFTEKLEFELPKAADLAVFIQSWVDKSTAEFSCALSANAMASLLGDGISIANTAAILQEAVNRMIGRVIDGETPEVIEQDFVTAIETVLR